MRIKRISLEENFQNKIRDEFTKSAGENICGSAFVEPMPTEKYGWRSVVTFMVLWCKLNQLPLNTFKIVSVFDGAPVAQVTDNTNLYVLFKDEEQWASFRQWMREYNDEAGVFPAFPLGETITTTAVSYPMPNYDKTSIDPHTFEAGNYLCEQDIEMLIWLNENCIGKFYRHTGMFFFENASDATHFKLKWVGNDK